MNLADIANEALAEIRLKSQRELYRTDYHAWRHDILGYRSYEAMNEITWQCLHGDKTKTAIASANGVSKSFEMSCMIAWASSVFEPGDVTSIVTAPSIQQVEKVIFAYLKSHFGQAAANNNRLPGRLSEKLEWIYDGENGKTFLAYGRVPSKGKEMAVFQGVRGVKGKVFVFSDEGGAIEQDMFTAMEAVTTGSGSRAVVMGNPDYPGAYWRRFWDKTKPEGQRWATYNISAFSLPTMTGETVYPDDPEMNARFLSAITSREWIEDKQAIWEPNESRYLSKVMGQFPEDDDSSFFPQVTMDTAYNAEIEPSGDKVMGVDVARYGQDESVIAVNTGGVVRVMDTWGKTSLVESARKVHRYAIENDITEVRIDTTGVGGGVYDVLDDPDTDEFDDGDYVLIGWDNGSRSPDIAQWSNKRAYSYDNLRQQMNKGKLSLDYADEDLRQELMVTTYKFNTRGAIQITPKDEIKKGLSGKSPDRLDAVVMAATNLDPWYEDPDEPKPGDRVLMDPSAVMEFAGADRWYGGYAGF